jgi:hypothetical protein
LCSEVAPGAEHKEHSYYPFFYEAGLLRGRHHFQNTIIPIIHQTILLCSIKMSDNTAYSKAQAKALVKKIADDHGYLGEDVLATMSDDTRKKVVDAMLKKDRIIGASVVT